jgi:phosphate transport system permease protein
MARSSPLAGVATKARMPIISSGAVSPSARAMPMIVPVRMPGSASGINDPSSVLPMQIFLWSDEIDRGFVQNTSAAIIVLLVFLLAMNGLAIYLRNKFEVRW